MFLECRGSVGLSHDTTVIFRLLCLVGTDGLCDTGGPVGYCQE